MMPSRCYATCSRYLDKGSYSSNQWRKPIETSRSYACVEGGGQINGAPELARAAQTARRNNATHVTFERYALDHPFAEGGFRSNANQHVQTHHSRPSFYGTR